MSIAALGAKLLGLTVPYALIGVLLDVSIFGTSLVGVVGPIAVVVIAGFFTVRSSVARIWRENYEAEVERSTVLERERDEQRELKHAALTELAAAKNMLTIEQAKTDLSPIVSALGEQRSLLAEIRDGVLARTTTRVVG